MCFFSQVSRSAVELSHRFNANFNDAARFTPGVFNAFTFPLTPIITHRSPQEIELAQWGLIPHWAKDSTIQTGTLNARIETLSEKPSFKHVIHNRCLILADGFFEWQWLDDKGKNKQQYLISMPDQALYAYAGLYSDWLNPVTHQTIRTYTIITTEANAMMAQIHNSKKRMPIVVANEFEWLNNHPLHMANDLLIPLKVSF